MKNKWLLLFGLSLTLPAMAQVPVVGAVDTNMVKGLFFAGLQEKLSENYSKAAETFNKILAIDPKNAAIYFEIATINYRQNKIAEAETAIKKATEIDQNNIWYWKFLVEMYKRKGNMEGLIPAFNELIRLDPDNDSYYFDRSNAWLLAGKPQEAASGYDELEKKFGSSAELVAARSKLDSKGNAGNGTLKADDLEALKKEKLEDPDDFELDLAIADAYKKQKNSAEANAALQIAFANPMMPAEQKIKIIMMLFSNTKNQQRMLDGKGLAQIAVKTHPDDPAIRGTYGEVLYQLGDLQGALAEFQAVLKITDQLYKAWEQVLNIQNKLGMYKETVKTGDDALAVYPNQAILYYYTAQALTALGRNAEALTQIKAALQLDAENTVYTELYKELTRKINEKKDNK